MAVHVRGQEEVESLHQGLGMKRRCAVKTWVHTGSKSKDAKAGESREHGPQVDGVLQ